MNFDLLNAHSKEDHADSIANYLPNDVTFEAKLKTGTNLRGLLLGLGSQLLKIEQWINTLANELGVDNPSYLIEEWERALGIPDHCFSNTDTIERRRANILIKLAKMNAQTASDFEQTALLFGYTVTVLSGMEAISAPYLLVIPEITTNTEARFSIVVLYTPIDALLPVFPMTFPITFGGQVFGDMACALSQMKPANCQIIFIEV